MQFTAPIPFSEALASLAAKTILPTSLGSDELMQIQADLRERSFFSARTTNASYVQEIRDLVTGLVDGKTDQATVRLTLKDKLDAIGYTPADGERGAIKDLSSDRRLNLVIRTNTEMAQGYGNWRQSQDPAVLDAWPAQELIRAEDREEPRMWRERWRGAGGHVYGGKAPGLNIEPGFSEGRYIAPKNDPVWIRISAFGVPYPPFDFNSGIDVRDVGRREAEEMGVIQAGQRIQPEQRPFESIQTVAAPARDADLRSALLKDLGDQYEFRGETLVRKTDALAPAPAPPAPAPVPVPPAPAPAPTPPTAVPPPPAPAPAAAPAAPLPPLKDKPDSPVSAALNIKRAKPAAIRKAIASIDSVHDDGKLPIAKITGSGFSSRTATGYYDPRSSNIGVRNQVNETVTVAHEVGHFLDHKALGIGGRFASEHHADLQEWRDAVRSTQLYRSLDSDKRAHTGPVRWIEYALQPVELFARSYAQWIAQRSGDADMLASIARHRAKPYGAGHWDWKDFEPVARALDNLFRRKGWLLKH